MNPDQTYYWVYILQCNNNTYYTGYTNDLNKRYQSHVDGSGKCKYTRSFKPICIAQAWKIYEDKALAMQIERDIKKLPRKKKEFLIANPIHLSTQFGITCKIISYIPVIMQNAIF